jgi:hypothetical protein
LRTYLLSKQYHVGENKLEIETNQNIKKKHLKIIKTNSSSSILAARLRETAHRSCALRALHAPRPQPWPGSGFPFPTWAEIGPARCCTRPAGLHGLLGLGPENRRLGRGIGPSARRQLSPLGLIPVQPFLAVDRDRTAGRRFRRIKNRRRPPPPETLEHSVPLTLSLSMEPSGGRPWRPEERWRRRRWSRCRRARSPVCERAAVERPCGGDLPARQPSQRPAVATNQVRPADAFPYLRLGFFDFFSFFFRFESKSPPTFFVLPQADLHTSPGDWYHC